MNYELHYCSEILASTLVRAALHEINGRQLYPRDQHKSMVMQRYAKSE
jgi:hypothetical protein